ncbi:maltoporin [Roseateles sp. YR242]|uniref:maltoporin n=1 Tax=Roseateles sp. YR242 TaxID=1855305 RepID=UPI0008D01597|nr:carbohydrate porin [Roseateles sp. YR242]SEK25430.1 maltoporin [Roseateles sp. YR242]
MIRIAHAHKRIPLAIGLLMAAGASQALDWTGYFRAGPGGTSNGTSRACYALNGGTQGMKYRLGNECDFYGEFQLSQGYKKDGVEYKVTLMTDYYDGSTDQTKGDWDVAQMYAEAKGFDIAPEATFWIGKERGRRGDVHIVDTYFTEMVGVGAGAKGFTGFGPGLLGVAYYKTDKDSNERPGHRGNVEYVDAAVNEGGKLSVFGTVTKGQFAGGTNGWGLTFKHEQERLFGTSLNNVIWLQYAQGSTGLNSNFGNLTDTSAAKKYRVVESVNWQTGAWGGMAMALYAQEKDNQGVSTKSGSLGGRVSYAVTRNFKLLTEAGVSQYKPDGGETARLTKVTFAPTLSVGPALMDRPEFRLYVTHAKWNRAAGNVTNNLNWDEKTSGTSFGAQVEMWF